MIDMAELARNSVMQSGFEDERKRAWLGERYADGVLGCEPAKCNVTPARVTFRSDLLRAERALVGLEGDVAHGKLPQEWLEGSGPLAPPVRR